MRVKIWAVAATLMLCSMGSAWAQGDKAETPAVIAVKFHADWCGSCKAMGPVFEELQAKYDTQPVLFVTLDHTREFNRRQSQYLAKSLGLHKIWAANGGKTGFILLIDGQSGEVVRKLTREHDIKKMGAALLESVQSAAKS